MSTENDILDAVKTLAEACGLDGLTVVIRDRQTLYLDEEDGSGDALPVVIVSSAGTPPPEYILNGQVVRKYRVTVGLVEAGNELPEKDLAAHQTSRQQLRNTLNRVGNPPVLPGVTAAWDLEVRDVPPFEPGELDRGYRYTAVEVTYTVTEAA